ncbi:hypothetical protein F4811DRAFT_175375 [Daldinia bambusicola]|nr:hypothetical protein F4811DRAFT_175375 [Daldinia bambusicola]
MCSSSVTPASTRSHIRIASFTLPTFFFLFVRHNPSPPFISFLSFSCYNFELKFRVFLLRSYPILPYPSVSVLRLVCLNRCLIPSCVCSCSKTGPTAGITYTYTIDYSPGLDYPFKPAIIQITYILIYLVGVFKLVAT